jgi:hypothetical protein
METGQATDGAASLPERVERALVVRIVLSVAIVVLVAAQIVSHVPEGVIRDDLRTSWREPAQKLQRLTTTEMQWGVFAPEPRRTSLKLGAVVEFADGSTASWHVPQGAVLGTNLRFYRWRKWLERVRSEDYRSLWRPTASWIATLYDDRVSPVTSVTLVRWHRENRIRGPQEPYERTEYYTLAIDEHTEGDGR